MSPLPMVKEKKSEMLRIRCTKSTKKKWAAFVIDGDYPNYEEALLDLLQNYKPRRFI